MRIRILPGYVSGFIQAPASKSVMQRACALALLHTGTTRIHNFGNSADDKAALEIIKDLGAKIKYISGDCIEIISAGIHPISNTLHCGESGLSMRMFTSIAALSSKKITISGSGSLTKRPMYFFEDTLPQLHVRIKTNAGNLPIEVQGPMQPKNIKVDGSLSSQFLTGLLISMAHSAVVKTEIEVSHLNSKPYIDITLQILKEFGYLVDHRDYKTFTITPVKKEKSNIDFTVEGDWSSASFLFVAAAIHGDVTVSGLQINSQQADKDILKVLELAGAKVIIQQNSIRVIKNILRAFQFDATHCPDLFPPIVALAAYCPGETIITGIERLFYKETNRAETLKAEFEKLGVHISLHQNSMAIQGGSQINSCSTYSHHDHRIAMALAIVATAAKEPILIDDAEAVNKSYPRFFNDLESLKTTNE